MKRASTTEVMKHPFFASIDWLSVAQCELAYQLEPTDTQYNFPVSDDEDSEEDEE